MDVDRRVDAVERTLNGLQRRFVHQVLAGHPAAADAGLLASEVA